MNVDDEAAREARARSIHKLIEEIKAPQGKADEETKKADPAAEPTSIREKIHKKMQELDKEPGS